MLQLSPDQLLHFSLLNLIQLYQALKKNTQYTEFSEQTKLNCIDFI